MRMDYQAKKMVIDALMKAVDSAPIKTNSRYLGEYLNGTTSHHIVTKENYDIWRDYVSSILKITSRYVNVDPCLMFIKQIDMQSGINYNDKIVLICQKLLELAKSIL